MLCTGIKAGNDKTEKVPALPARQVSRQHSALCFGRNDMAEMVKGRGIKIASQFLSLSPNSHNARITLKERSSLPRLFGD
jgi:hypothetical protein